MKLLSVNIGKKRLIESTSTGIYKLPVGAPVRVTCEGLKGDFIASSKHHGGPDQAIYIYGAIDYAWWAHELGRELEPGTFGENLTVSDLESTRFFIGDRFHIGEVILQVTAPRIPCETFARRMGDPQFVRRFREAERPGMYCRVLQEGVLQVGNEMTFEPFRSKSITVVELFRSFYAPNDNEARLRYILKAPIASRARKDTEEKLEKLLGEK